MKYLHTMVRVTDLEASLDFYCNKLGLTEVERYDYPESRFTLVMLAAPGDEEAQVELTYNYDPEALRTLPTPHGQGRDHQPAAARRAHGLRALARQRLHRTAAEGRCPAAPGALGLDGKHRRVVKED
jgi:catechol 2,3-dioxygenase-like lactoylglutathione lyase family enzyme